MRLRPVLRLTAIAGFIYAALAGTLFVAQRTIMYPANPARIEPAQADLPGIVEQTITTEDGERLVVWHRPPAEGRPVLLYFHGNAGSLATRIRVARFRALTADGTGLFATSWRGYGGSSGSPSEAGLHADARAAHAAAAALYGADRLVVYGESLGTGPAVRLAAERPVRALVLETPYTSTAEVAEGVYFFLPVRLLMLDQFRSDEIIGRVTVPKLVMHGTSDFVVPYRQGRRLFELAPAPKRFISFEGGGHEDSLARGGLGEVRAFLEDVAAGRVTGNDVRTYPAR